MICFYIVLFFQAPNLNKGLLYQTLPLPSVCDKNCFFTLFSNEFIIPVEKKTLFSVFYGVWFQSIIQLIHDHKQTLL